MTALIFFLLCAFYLQEALQNKNKCLNAASFERQLMSVRKGLAKSQADTVKLKEWLCKLVSEFFSPSHLL